MRDDELQRAIEAVVMVALEPVSPGLMAELFEEPADRVEAAAVALAGVHERAGRGFVLVKVAGGWRFQSHADLAPYVERYVLDGQSARMSAAALETLAIVAYRQPVSRSQISSLRGVNVDGVVRLLEQRGFIHAVGRAEGPGQPVLFGTTELFLERLGVDSLGDLPPIEEFLPGPEAVVELEDRLRPSMGD
jgi:segregation and condensation protein B